MMECCKNQTTAFCPECGSDLEAKSLTGLKKHLESRLQSARKRLDKWEHDNTSSDAAIEQGIARSTDTIIQMDSWIKEAIG
ncbi:MAG TPA: hypothetical protein ENH62_01685 [Marinobacter sp.]|uniref:Uncharacterized protein n=1 Tax=marine sediment metagenome TaxID=412755 RepID=A0A0F8ZXF7_9ZZZZ|nr:hypothetical protein [Marinobacter sp.]